MTRGRAGVLVLGIAAIAYAASPAHAQNPAALAKAAARSAGAFDSLVTPEALRALQRMADSTEAAAGKSKPPAARSTTPRPPAAQKRTPPARRTAPPPVESAGTETEQQSVAAEPAADSGTAITMIAARGTEDTIELRVVAPGQTEPALSEPFRSGDHSRLFLTFAGAKLALATPPELASAGKVIAGVDIAELDGAVRIALDLTALEGYGLEAEGDTTILWLARPASPAVAEGPDDLALVREAARAGWAAFRSDVGSVASTVAGVVANAGNAIGAAAASGWHATAQNAASGAKWLGAAVPFASISRGLVLIALLLTPPLAALKLLRRRQTARPRAAAIVGLEAHAVHDATPSTTPAPKAGKQPKPPKQPKQQKPKKPAVTRTTADARLWAARTLAANGADVGEIARQTGLSREAAVLLVRRAQKS